MSNLNGSYKNRQIVLMFTILVAAFFTTIASAAPFEQGKQRLSLAIGSASLLNENYILVGMGYGYYLHNGLELGLDLDLWLDGDPNIYQVTPEIKYVFTNMGRIKPYLGTFYRRNYIEKFDDLDAYGYRGGVYWVGRSNVYFGYGITKSILKGCNESIYFSCESVYSDFSVMLVIN